MAKKSEMPIQQLVEKIGEASQFSGTKTFVPMMDRSGQHVTRELTVKTYPDTLAEIANHVRDLPASIIEKLCHKHHVPIQTHEASPAAA